MESNEYNSLNISSPQCGKKAFHIDKIKKCKINKNQQINNFPLYINDYLFPKHKSKPKNKYNFYHLINFQLQKYNSTPEQKNIMIINDIINAKSNHFLAAFKDFLITDYIDEFLKRYFTFDESEELIPKFHLYYQNYLNFFCKGLFLDFKANKILQDNGELQAELYYNNNYGSDNVRKGKKGNSCDSKSGSSNENKNISKINKIKSIFSKSIKNKISGIDTTKFQDKNDISNIFYKSKNETITLNNDTKIFNDDNIYTNENSLINLLKSLINKKISRKKMNENKNMKNNINEKNVFRIFKNILSESPIKSARYQNYIKSGMYNKTTKKVSSIKIFTKNIPMIFKNKNHNLSNDMKTPFLEKTKVNSRNNQSRNSRTNFSSRGNNSINIFVKNSKNKKSNKKRNNNSKSNSTKLKLKNFPITKLNKRNNQYSSTFNRILNHKISKKIIYNVLKNRNNSNNSSNSSKNYKKNYIYSFQSNNSNNINHQKVNYKIKQFQNMTSKSKSINNKHKIQNRIIKQKQNLSLYNSNSIYNNFHININNNILLLNNNNSGNIKHFIPNKNNIKSFSKQRKVSTNIQNNNNIHFIYRKKSKNIKSRNEININLNKYKTEIRNMQINLKQNNKNNCLNNKKNNCAEKSKSKNKNSKNKEHLVRNKSNNHFNNNSRINIKKFNQKDLAPSLRNFKKLNNTNKNSNNKNNQKINIIFDYKKK